MRLPNRACDDLGVGPEQATRGTKRLRQGLLGREARGQGMGRQASLTFGEQAAGQPWGPGGPQPINKVPTGTQLQPAAPAASTTPGGSLADVYKFFQSDLENQKNQALAGSRSDAAARGVFYGTPLTGSEADINTQYLRGLGQLQAGMYGNEQQNTNQRLQLATQLFGMGANGQPSAPGAMDFSGLASLFGPSPAVSAPRNGPAITPMQKTGDKITPKPNEPQ